MRYNCVIMDSKYQEVEKFWTVAQREGDALQFAKKKAKEKGYKNVKIYPDN